MMRFAMLGSGSKGNATLIEHGGTRILIDCGFNLRETEARLLRLGVEPASLTAILVTHEHGDHLGGVGRLARRHRIPVWMTYGTRRAWQDPEVPHLIRFNPHQRFAIGSLAIEPYPVPHDAQEPCQYVIGDGRLRLGVLSDAGHISAHMRAVLAGCDGLLLECNHDLRMLRDGPYPESLKRRVGSDRGHLSNDQAAGLLQAYEWQRLQHLVLTHLSESNNRPELALAAVHAALDGAALPSLRCAHQEQGLDWSELR
ncbi:Phosphoribosyl 1,2-cyclic phosphodiesterase [Solimonas aquatica]|uniref:Phosphoribosyl 1,2-cyclic phosphodiesterase n=1 Tax=Solimonas aquatica TaxID=489703 RepID=A0A1H9FW91_9GAMM|nr:MBL fold metallo-hydrolase [Solimonas aquatica]SEQ42104.1 Phosphoribosyl 1,2-cyclic phosphodiesterase [Solimonas aquatica]